MDQIIKSQHDADVIDGSIAPNRIVMLMR